MGWGRTYLRKDACTCFPSRCAAMLAADISAVRRCRQVGRRGGRECKRFWSSVGTGGPRTHACVHACGGAGTAAGELRQCRPDPRTLTCEQSRRLAARWWEEEAGACCGVAAGDEAGDPVAADVDAPAAWPVLCMGAWVPGGGVLGVGEEHGPEGAEQAEVAIDRP